MSFFIDRSVDWRKKYKSVLENVFEVPMIEEYDHRHQLYVFYFSIFMPSFHLFPVGLFPTFKFGYHQPSIGEKRKQFLPVKKAKSKG